MDPSDLSNEQLVEKTVPPSPSAGLPLVANSNATLTEKKDAMPFSLSSEKPSAGTDPIEEATKFPSPPAFDTPHSSNLKQGFTEKMDLLVTDSAKSKPPAKAECPPLNLGFEESSFSLAITQSDASQTQVTGQNAAGKLSNQPKTAAPSAKNKTAKSASDAAPNATAGTQNSGAAKADNANKKPALKKVAKTNLTPVDNEVGEKVGSKIFKKPQISENEQECTIALHPNTKANKKERHHTRPANDAKAAGKGGHSTGKPAAAKGSSGTAEQSKKAAAETGAKGPDETAKLSAEPSKEQTKEQSKAPEGENDGASKPKSKPEITEAKKDDE